MLYTRSSIHETGDAMDGGAPGVVGGYCCAASTGDCSMSSVVCPMPPGGRGYVILGHHRDQNSVRSL